jgi:hypothetical protein
MNLQHVVFDVLKHDMPAPLVFRDDPPERHERIELGT